MLKICSDPCCPALWRYPKELRRDDIEAYVAFCQKPPKSWISLKHEPRFINKNGQRVPNSKWRPFVITVTKVDTKNGVQADKQNYVLSENSLRTLFAVTSSFYNYLIQEEYTIINPMLLIRQKSKYFVNRQSTTKIRRLSELQWGYVIETAELMAEEMPEHHERTLFIINMLYGMYLRISELTATQRWAPTMSDFYRDNDGRWWFTTVGKGNKERLVSVSTAMLKALKQYRKSMKLPLLPSPNDQTPLITKHKGSGAVTSTRYIRSIVQSCFDRACERLIKDNQHEEAEQLAAATVHWLRHT